MARRDLLSARLVCKDWLPAASKELCGRKDSFGKVTEDEDGEVNDESITSFIDVMTPASSHMPVARLNFAVNLFSLPPQALLKLLTFSAPWVKSMNIEFRCPFRLRQGTRETTQAVELASKLTELSGMEFPKLEELD